MGDPNDSLPGCRLYPNRETISCACSLHKPRRVPGRCGDAATDDGEPESRTVASRGEVESRRREGGLAESALPAGPSSQKE
eukprot:685578-Pyramimonas_sp.AAC.1